MSENGNDNEAPQEFLSDIECPNCGDKLYFIHYRTSISYEEGIEIETFFCKKCLYKKSSMNQLSNYGPRRLVLGVKSAFDLRIIVYRSPEAKIEIPEFFAEVEPGEDSSGEITTVEGILSKLLQRVQLFDSEDAEPGVIEELRNKITRAMEGKEVDFTLIIDDPKGLSRISSSKTITVKSSSGQL